MGTDTLVRSGSRFVCLTICVGDLLGASTEYIGTITSDHVC
jgi:hypothetical protein